MIDVLGAVESSFGQINGLTITLTMGVIAVSLALWTIVRPNRFPPGPRGLPFVGSIFDMGDSPEDVFGKWAKKYGDIFGFKVGERWMVVLSHQEVIKEALLKHGVEFAGRPDLHSLGLLTDGFKDIAFSTYSDTWKLHRKLAHTALRHFATGKPLQNLISSGYPKLQKELSEIGEKPVYPKILLNLLLYSVFSQMCFGNSSDLKDPDVLEWMKINDKLNEEFGLGLAADYFAWAKYIPTRGPRVLKRLLDRFDKYMEDKIEGTKKRYDPNNINDFYSLLLKAQEDARNEGENVDKLTDSHIYQTISDIFGAGVQTTVDTLTWALAIMAEFPAIQSKVQKEIENVIGRDRLPMIEDRRNLSYTEATIYEVLRFSTIAPVLLPHSTIRDTEFRGYVIPKGTIIMFNVHSMHFDDREWKDPNSFLPEHFLDEGGTVRQHPPSFLPFGAGRRSCLGEAVTKADLFLIFTWLMQNYTFSKVSGKESESLLKVVPNTAASGRVLQPYEIIIKEIVK